MAQGKTCRAGLGFAVVVRNPLIGDPVAAFVVTDAQNREQSFFWLRYFAGSKKFIDNPDAYVGKALKLRWQEVELFLPLAKGYFKMREIAGVDVE